MKKALRIGVLAIGLNLGISPLISYAQHYVTRGETMYIIAQEFGMDLKDLIELNPHIRDPDRIFEGDYIIIRSGVETEKDLTDYARSLQSVTAFRYGESNFPYEVDSSAWIQGIYEKFGVDLPRTATEQSLTGEPIEFENLQMGDLMFFSTKPDKEVTHVGIYMGYDFLILNLDEKHNVEIMSTWSTWTRDYFLWGARHEL